MVTDFEARMKLARDIGNLLGTILSILLYDNENLNNQQYRKLAEAYLDEKLETVKDQSSQWVIQSFLPNVIEILQDIDNRKIYIKDEYREYFIDRM